MKKDFCTRVIPFNPTPPRQERDLSSHELNQPGTYQDVSDTTVTAQFKAKEDSLPESLKGNTPLYFLAWTTTPWTLPSNTALTVGPKIDYVVVHTFNQYTFQPIRVILAKALVGKQFSGKYEACRLIPIGIGKPSRKEQKKYLFSLKKKSKERNS